MNIRRNSSFLARWSRAAATLVVLAVFTQEASAGDEYGYINEIVVMEDNPSFETSLLSETLMDLAQHSASFQELLDLAQRGDIDGILDLQRAAPDLFAGSGGSAKPGDLGLGTEGTPDAPDHQLDVQAWLDGTADPNARLTGGESGPASGGSSLDLGLKDFGFGTAGNTDSSGSSAGADAEKAPSGTADSKQPPASETLIFDERVDNDDGSSYESFAAVNEDGSGMISETWRQDGKIVRSRVTELHGDGTESSIEFRDGRIWHNLRRKRNGQPRPNDDSLPLLFFWSYENVGKGDQPSTDDIVSQPGADEGEGEMMADIKPGLGLSIAINPGDGSWEVRARPGGNGVTVEQIPYPIER